MAPCRKGYWEAAVSKSAVGREGLARIGRIFELDASWSKKPPAERKRLRDAHLRPHIASFFAWVDEQRPLFEHQRGYDRSALEYTHNQREALVRFLEDGKLALTNNRSERAIKSVVLGRRAWLFCGSDDHAKNTAALYSIVCSARLHGIEPEEYLRCLIRLVPLWPSDRMLELAPLFWVRTHARLDPQALAEELGPISIPVEPLDTTVAGAFDAWVGPPWPQRANSTHLPDALQLAYRRTSVAELAINRPLPHSVPVLHPEDSSVRSDVARAATYVFLTLQAPPSSRSAQDGVLVSLTASSSLGLHATHLGPG